MLSLERIERLQRLTGMLKEAGFEGIRYEIRKEKKRSWNLFRKEVEKHEVSYEEWACIEAGRNGKRCVTSFQMEDTENDFESIKAALLGAAAISERSYTYEPYAGQRGSEKEESGEADEETVIAERLITAEEAACSVPGVAQVSQCAFEVCEEEVEFWDEDQNNLSDNSRYACARIEVIAGQGEQVFSKAASTCGMGASDIDWKKFAEEAAEGAVSGLRITEIRSGKYPVILKAEAAAEMLETYLPVFDGEHALDQTGLLYGKEGKKIAASGLTIRELPHCEKGRVRRSVDDEGVQVREKELVKEGVFTTVLCNKNTVGRVSTGNGFKHDAQSDVGIQATNVYLSEANGKELPLSEMEQRLGEGLLVTEIGGAFAGINLDSGAFSLIAKGRVIRDGKEKEAFCDDDFG